MSTSQNSSVSPKLYEENEESKHKYENLYFKNIDRVNCRCKGNARDDCTNVFRIYHLSDNG